MQASAEWTSASGLSPQGGESAVRAAPRTVTQRWAMGAAISFVLHATVCVVIFLGLRHLPPAPMPQQSSAMAVELLPLPAAPPSPPKNLAPGPQQTEARVADQPKKVRLALTKVPQLQRRDAPTVPDRAEPDHAPTQRVTAAQATTAPLAAALPPKDVSAAPTEGATMAASISAEQSWENLVLARLLRNKRYPGEAEAAGEEDVVYVRITVDRAGNVLDSAIVRSRHFLPLDNGALDLVRRSSPLPSPPASISSNTVQFVVPVNYFIRHHGG